MSETFVRHEVRDRRDGDMVPVGETVAPAMRASPLTKYALAGLRRCWMNDRATWSHKFHLDGRESPNESVPHSDLYYSLNVLLGLSKARGALAGEPYDLGLILGTICTALPDVRGVRNGAWGMALWAAAELDLAAPPVAADRLRRKGGDADAFGDWTAQDIGLTLSGVAAQAVRDAAWLPLARSLAHLILENYRGAGALFQDSCRGTRRHFATFATQVYLALALYQFGELVEDAVAIAAANACAARLIALQGERGQWPWFYLPRSDRVLEPYEVYSVHQHGMGPALLHHAVKHGVPGACAAIERGFRWLFGANDMNVSMLVPQQQLIYRSQARRGLSGRRSARLVRAALVATDALNCAYVDASQLRITQEMRSYEYGWLLWSFAGNSDFPELTEHAAFSLSHPETPLIAHDEIREGTEAR